MAADAPAKPPACNPCCVEWQVKYAGMKIRWDALKQMVRLLEKASREKQAEIDRLKQNCEKEAKEKESVARAALEKEVLDLMSEISSLQQRLDPTVGENDEKVKLFQDQDSRGEKGIGQRKDHLKEKKFLTCTVWWAIPVIWLPIVFWCISTSVRMGHTLLEIAMMVASGIFIWTSIEYTLHRCLFHMKTKSYWRSTIHYLLLGCHHKHPIDSLCLAFPPTAVVILCIFFWNLVKLFATPSTTPALFGGGLFGYVVYDAIHHYLHHG